MTPRPCRAPGRGPFKRRCEPAALRPHEAQRVRSRHAPPFCSRTCRSARPCRLESIALHPHEARRLRAPTPPVLLPAPSSSLALRVRPSPTPPPRGAAKDAPCCFPHPTETRLPTPGAVPAPPAPATRHAHRSSTLTYPPRPGPRRTVPNAIAFAVPRLMTDETRAVSATYENRGRTDGLGAGRRPEKTTSAGRKACPDVPVRCREGDEAGVLAADTFRRRTPHTREARGAGFGSRCSVGPSPGPWTHEARHSGRRGP